MGKLLRRLENVLAAALLAALAILPLLALASRAFLDRAWASAIPIVQHLNLLLAFFGAVLAAREGKLLRLSTGELFDNRSAARWVGALAAIFTSFVCGLLARSSWDFAQLEREFESKFFGEIPLWPLLAFMALSFVGVALRVTLRSIAPVGGRLLNAVPFVVATMFFTPERWEGFPAWPFVLVAVAMTLLGAPLFAPLGGLAVMLFLGEGIPAEAVPAEMYRLASSPFLPAIPLFTLVGLLLTRGESARRIVELFRALLGWLPGGTAVLCVLSCAFLSVFTGGSGVTILALGGLLFQALNADGYKERFSIGLLTASGSLGLLLPPALPLILFGIAAQISIEDLFLGGVLPGILLLVLMSLAGMAAGSFSKVPRSPFDRRAALGALWEAKFELLIPVVVLLALFSGWATLLEASALAVGYVTLVEVVIHREIPIGRELGRVLAECATLVGGVLIILCAATGLSSYLVDAQLPMQLLAWMQENVESRLLFLLGLNLFLLVVGCFLDIFSATFVVVPLLLPLGAAYGIDPVHLGIIFVANLELGYLTPPVGLNLFLAAYRFDRPLLEIYRSAVPMLFVLGLGVLLITYFPFLTTFLLSR